MAHKSIETKYYEERASFFEDLKVVGALSRRGFLQIAGVSAGIAAAKGLVVRGSVGIFYDRLPLVFVAPAVKSTSGAFEQVAFDATAAGIFTANGGGTALLSGVNTYNSFDIISGGVLNVNADSGLGAFGLLGRLNGGFLRGVLAIELLADLLRLPRRQPLETAQELVEVAVRHSSTRIMMALSFFHPDYHGWVRLPSSCRQEGGPDVQACAGAWGPETGTRNREDPKQGRASFSAWTAGLPVEP